MPPEAPVTSTRLPVSPVSTADTCCHAAGRISTRRVGGPEPRASSAHGNRADYRGQSRRAARAALWPRRHAGGRKRSSGAGVRTTEESKRPDQHENVMIRNAIPPTSARLSKAQVELSFISIMRTDGWLGRIRHLAALKQWPRKGRSARAADRLGYTQSAVSQQISARANRRRTARGAARRAAPGHDGGGALLLRHAAGSSLRAAQADMAALPRLGRDAAGRHCQSIGARVLAAPARVRQPGRTSPSS
jgi:hypothetical protein